MFAWVTIQINENPDSQLYLALQLGLASSLVSLARYAWYLLEVVTMLTNHKRRALHDYIAGSVVVRV